MNEDFLGYDLAVKLKEKGFPQIKKGTLAMYNEEGEWYSLSKTLDDYYYSFEDFDDKDCVCPTISQVLKWLREEKKIHVTTGVTPKSAWRYVIMFCDERGLQEPTITKKNHLDYSDAIIAGIEYVLDNLI
jgi:hypothetical protein